MENAGSAVSEFVLAHYPLCKSVGVICGKGNNGGDGFVAARRLHDAGKQVRVLLLAEPSEVRGDAAEMLERLPASPVMARSWEELLQPGPRAVFDSDLLIDAILGTGFKPPVTGVYGEAILQLNQSKAPIVAVDIPLRRGCRCGKWTGRNRGPGQRRCNFHCAATGARLSGSGSRSDRDRTHRLARGSHRLFTPAQLDYRARHCPTHRPSTRRFGTREIFGHVLVIGGAIGKAGSAAMAGMAALRAGAGLSTVGTPKSALPTVAGFHPELMTEPLEETETGTISKRALGLRAPGRAGKRQKCDSDRSRSFAARRNRRGRPHPGEEMRPARRSGRRWAQRFRGPRRGTARSRTFSGDHAASRRDGAAHRIKPG